MMLFLVLFGSFMAWGAYENSKIPEVYTCQPMSEERLEYFKKNWFRLEREFIYRGPMVIDYTERLEPEKF